MLDPVQAIYALFAHYSKYDTDEKLCEIVKLCQKQLQDTYTYTEQVVAVYAPGTYLRRYKKGLSLIIATRCRCYSVCKKNRVIFIGHETDARFCASLFTKVYECIYKRCLSVYASNYNKGGETSGVFNDNVIKLLDKLKQTMSQDLFRDPDLDYFKDCI